MEGPRRDAQALLLVSFTLGPAVCWAGLGAPLGADTVLWGFVAWQRDWVCQRGWFFPPRGLWKCWAVSATSHGAVNLGASAVCKPGRAGACGPQPGPGLPGRLLSLRVDGSPGAGPWLGDVGGPAWGARLELAVSPSPAAEPSGGPSGAASLSSCSKSQPGHGVQAALGGAATNRLHLREAKPRFRSVVVTTFASHHRQMTSCVSISKELEMRPQHRDLSWMRVWPPGACARHWELGGSSGAWGHAPGRPCAVPWSPRGNRNDDPRAS